MPEVAPPNKAQHAMLIRWMNQITSTDPDRALILSRLKMAFELGRRQGQADTIGTKANPATV